MPNFTSNFNFFLPLVNDPIDEDLWGGQLNTNWSTIDGELETRTIDYNFAGFKMVNAKIEDMSETVVNLGNVSGVLVLDYAASHFQHGIVTGDITSVTINNLPPSGSGAFMLLELTQDGAGGHTISFSSAFQAVGGSIVLSTDPNAEDRLTFTSRDAGTTIKTTIEKDWISL
jgi:hypothetical protein